MRSAGKTAFYLAVGWIVFWTLAAVSAPFLLKEHAERIAITEALTGPSLRHGFGTDMLGRDLLSRILCGSSVSLGVSACAVLVALLLGTWLGAMAGYFGGFRERLVLAATDLFLCFPAYFLILSVVALIGPSLWNLVWILGLTSWMGTARLVRAEVLTLKEREFVLAARALGVGDFTILGRHLVPNAFGPVRVTAVLGLSTAILTEAGLSFLGVGVQPPTPSWGNLLMDGKASLGAAWWMIFFPGVVIFLSVLSLHVVSEELKRHAG